jgi:hypothetical protein
LEQNGGTMKRYMGLLIVAFFALATGQAGGATGEKGGGSEWERLGSREVDYNRDHDTIYLGKSEGRFKQLQIRVKGAPIEISDMVITFGNDEKFNPNLRQRFDEGSDSRNIDLPGDRRTIKRIDFRYQSINRREGKGRVEVYAR